MKEDSGDASGPGAREPSPTVSALRASPPIAEVREMLAGSLYEAIRGWAATQGRYSGRTWAKASAREKDESRTVIDIVLASTDALGLSIVPRIPTSDMVAAALPLAVERPSKLFRGIGATAVQALPPVPSHAFGDGVTAAAELARDYAVMVAAYAQGIVTSKESGNDDAL